MPAYFSTLSDNASTLVARYFPSTSERTAGVDSLRSGNFPLTDSTPSQEAQSKKQKRFRIPSTSIKKTSLPSLLQQRRASYPREADETQDAKDSNSFDPQAQLAILGYRQELHRSWDFWSLFSLSCCNVGIMSESLAGLDASYASWGPILMTVGVVITSSLLVCVNAVFAEMASAFPVAGAMFSWTYKLARANPHLRNWARLLSWIVGFCLFTSHLLLQIEIGREFSRLFSSTLLSSGAKWNVTDTQIRAIALAYIFVCGCTSLTPVARSPLAWKVIGITILILNVAACVVLRTTSSHQGNFHTLFASSPNSKDFGSKGYTLIRAWAISTITLGSEPVAHMAEEARNPASTVPRAIFYSSIFAGFWQLFCNIFVTLAITPMHLSPLPNAWKVVHKVFAHCPKPAAQFIMTSILITSFVSNIAQFLGTSRFFWALARDKAMPFAKFWRQVTSDHRPVRATCLMMSLCLVLAVVSLAPNNVILTISRLGIPFLIFFTYLTPLLIYFFADRGVLDRDGRNVFTLRCLSKPLALVSILFLGFLLGLYSVPEALPITIKTFPFGPFVGLGVILVSFMFWLVYGKSHFVGPVKSLTTWTVGYEVDLPTKLTKVAVRHDQETAHRQVGVPGQATTEDPRSEANLTTQNVQAFGIASAYRTYGSDGSLWDENEDPTDN